jgi:hypothetical protein
MISILPSSCSKCYAKRQYSPAVSLEFHQYAQYQTKKTPHFLLDLRLLITPLVYFGHCVVCSCWTCGFSLPLWYLLAIVLSVLVELAASHYLFGIFKPFLNEKPQVEQAQTTQWTKDTKGVMRSRKSNKNRQHNGQKNKDKRRNNDLQNIAQKTKDRTTRKPLNM